MGGHAFKGSRNSEYNLGPEQNPPDPNVDGITIIGLDTDDGPEHPLYDRRAFVDPPEEFVKDIAQQGYIQSVTITKDGDRNVLIAGRKRVLAGRKINENLAKYGQKERIRVPCRYRRGVGDSDAMGIMISENENRVEDTIEEKVDKLNRFLVLGGTEAEAATRFRVVPATISGWLKYSGTPNEVKDAVRARAMFSSEAIANATKPRKEQQAKAKSAIKAIENGAPLKKRGRPKGGGAPSRKVECNRLLKAIEEAGKKHIVHPEFALGMRFAMDLVTADVAGVKEIIKAKAPPEAGK